MFTHFGLKPFIPPILDNIYDDTPWLLLCDWLEEQGSEYANFIRTAIANELILNEGNLHVSPRFRRGYIYEYSTPKDEQIHKKFTDMVNKMTTAKEIWRQIPYISPVSTPYNAVESDCNQARWIKQAKGRNYCLPLAQPLFVNFYDATVFSAIADVMRPDDFSYSLYPPTDGTGPTSNRSAGPSWVYGVNLFHQHFYRVQVTAERDNGESSYILINNEDEMIQTPTFRLSTPFFADEFIDAQCECELNDFPDELMMPVLLYFLRNRHDPRFAR